MNKPKATPKAKVVHSIMKNLKGPYHYIDISKKLDEEANKTYNILRKDL